MGKTYHKHNREIRHARRIVRLRNTNAVNRCAKCGRTIEPEMIVVGSECCADCVIEECKRNGDWDD